MQKSTQNRYKSADYSQIEGSRYPLQLRWRPLAAAEAGAAASGAASSGHARAVAEMAGCCRLGRPRESAQGPIRSAPPISSPLIGGRR